MTTIQDRIIKDFDKLEVCYAGDKYISSWCEPLDLTEDEEKVIKQFLIQSIKEVQEETRKEDTKFMAWCECGDALECKTVPNEKGFMVNHEYYCFGCDETYVLVKKSITNKEKQK